MAENVILCKHVHDIRVYMNCVCIITAYVVTCTLLLYVAMAYLSFLRLIIGNVETDYFNQVFRRKNLVIKMMNVGGWGVNNSSPEHSSATVRNILTILGRIIEQVNKECRVQE